MGKNKRRNRSESPDSSYSRKNKLLERQIADLKYQLERDKKQVSKYRRHSRPRSRSISVSVSTQGRGDRQYDRQEHRRTDRRNSHSKQTRRRRSHSRRSRSPRPRHRQRSRQTSAATLPSISPMTKYSGQGRQTKSVSRSHSPGNLSTALTQISTGRVFNDTADADNAGGSCPRATSPEGDVLTITDDVELSDNDLNLLGEDPQKPVTNQIRFHKEVASRWAHILTNGLPDERAKGITGKYNVPINCGLLTPPPVNPEIKLLMPSTYVTRDNDHSNYQLLLSKGIIAVGNSINIVINNKESFSKEVESQLLENLSDSGRILTNLFYKISKVRQYLLMPLVDPQVKNLLKESPPGEMIFDSDITSQVQLVKAREKIGKDLRPTNVKGTQKSSFQGKKKGGGGTQGNTSTNARNQGNRKVPTHFRGEMRSWKGHRLPRDNHRCRPPPGKR